MGLLREEDKAQIKEMFNSRMKDPVNIEFFTGASGCEYCADTMMILKEVSDLDDRINLVVHEKEKEEHQLAFSKFEIDKVPALTVTKNGTDFGFRYFGIPSGYEFSTLLEDIILVSSDNPELSQDTLSKISSLPKDIFIYVFITPTCPYCPRAAILSHKLAFASDKIKSHVIEAIEFPALSDRYGVSAVPKIVANDKVQFEGALPEEDFVARILEAL